MRAIIFLVAVVQCLLINGTLAHHYERNYELASLPGQLAERSKIRGPIAVLEELFSNIRNISDNDNEDDVLRKIQFFQLDISLKLLNSLNSNIKIKFTSILDEASNIEEIPTASRRSCVSDERTEILNVLKNAEINLIDCSKGIANELVNYTLAVTPISLKLTIEAMLVGAHSLTCSVIRTPIAATVCLAKLYKRGKEFAKNGKSALVEIRELNKQYLQPAVLEGQACIGRVTNSTLADLAVIRGRIDQCLNNGQQGETTTTQ